MDVGALMVALAACLCEENSACGSPEFCYCGVLPGSSPVDMSGTDCDPFGQAWVRLTTGYAAQRVGQPNVQPENSVNSGLGFGLEVGILRGFPISSSPLEDEEILEATLQQVTDMETIRRAIICCPSLSAKDFILNGYQPLGPQGGLIGGSWTISVSVL